MPPILAYGKNDSCRPGLPVGCDSIGLCWISLLDSRLWVGPGLLYIISSSWDHWLPRIWSSQGGWRKCNRPSRITEAHVKPLPWLRPLTLLALASHMAKTDIHGSERTLHPQWENFKGTRMLNAVVEGMKIWEHSFNLSHHPRKWGTSPFLQNSHVCLNSFPIFFKKSFLFLVRCMAMLHISFCLKCYLKGRWGGSGS